MNIKNAMTFLNWYSIYSLFQYFYFSYQPLVEGRNYWCWFPLDKYLLLYTYLFHMQQLIVLVDKYLSHTQQKNLKIKLKT